VSARSNIVQALAFERWYCAMNPVEYLILTAGVPDGRHGR